MRALNTLIPAYLLSASAAASASAAVTSALQALVADPATVIAAALDHRASIDPFDPAARQTCIYADDALIDQAKAISAHTGLSVPQLIGMALEYLLLRAGTFPPSDGYVPVLPELRQGAALTVALYGEDLEVIGSRGGSVSKHLHEALRAVARDHTAVKESILRGLKVQKTAESDQKLIKRVSFKANLVHWATANTIAAHLDLSISQMIRLQLHS